MEIFDQYSVLYIEMSGEHWVKVECRTSRLFEVVVENDVFRRGQVLRQWSDVSTRQPVGTQDGIVADICPVNSLLKG